MPPSRPATSSLLRGYVCSSCRVKLQQSQSPPWLARNTSSLPRPEAKKRSKRPSKAIVKSSPEDAVVVRHYEQSSDGVRRLLDKDADDEVGRALDARLKVLENDLAVIRAQRRRESTDPLQKKLRSIIETVGQLDGGRKILEGDIDIGDEGLLVGNRSMSENHSLPNIKNSTLLEIPQQFFAAEGHGNIQHLNAAIRQIAENSGGSEPSEASRDLWKYYSLNRKSLSTAWHKVPPAFWELLWQDFSKSSEHNPNRMAHVRTLGEDMQSANLLLNPLQNLLYIEATFIDGNHKYAIDRWESARPALTFTHSTAIQYWELGVSMLANDNQPQRAQEAVEILYTLKGDKDHRVLVPLIRAWLLSNDPNSIQRAWAIYVRFSYHLSPNMEMQDYDNAAAIFLRAGKPEFALAVFKDMMLTGEPTKPVQDSVGLYRRTLQNVENLDGFDLSQEEISWEESKFLVELPRKNRNKFFYGSWIKKLIGEGQIDFAALVADLMVQHNMRPDARYLNGIIGAWFRSGSSKNYDKAEDMAWKMIAARLEFVKIRDQETRLEGAVRLLPGDDLHDFNRTSTRTNATKTATPATQETFSVLAGHYQEMKGRYHVQELLTALHATKLKPSTAFLNGMLSIGASSHRKQWTWTMFTRLVNDDGVTPDCDTFVLLWRRMKSHVDPVLNRTKAGFPSPQTLFSEMIKFDHVLAKEGFSRSLYDQIILCFGLSDDQVGTAVVLRAMQRHFSLHPDEATVRSIVLQLAKAGSRNADGYRSRRLNILDKAIQKRIVKVTLVMKSFKEKRAEELRRQGVDFEKLEGEKAAEETLELLCNVLMFVAETRMKESSQAGSDIDAKFAIEQLGISAAEHMGVPDCLPRSS